MPTLVYASWMRTIEIGRLRMDDGLSKLHKWLESDACIPIIDVCIKYSLKRNRELINQAVGEGENEVSIDHLRNEFWSFLYEYNFQNIDFVQYLQNDDLTKFINQISIKFIYYCRDKRRTIDPRRKYHQHIRDTLSEEFRTKRKKFTYKAMKHSDGAFYSYYAFSDERNLLIATVDLWGPHERNQFKEWNRIEQCDKLDVHQKQTILLLAEHFWNSSVEIFEGKYLLPINQLTSYIFDNYFVVGRKVEYPVNEDNENEPLDFEDKEKSRRPDYAFLSEDTKKDMNKLARVLVESWAGLQRKIFLKRQKDGMTLQDIEKGGFKSAAYHLKKIENSIKETLSLWGFFDLSDEDQKDVFSHFYQKLIEFCEKVEGTVICR